MFDPWFDRLLLQILKNRDFLEYFLIWLLILIGLKKLFLSQNNIYDFNYISAIIFHEHKKSFVNLNPGA